MENKLLSIVSGQSTRSVDKIIQFGGNKNYVLANFLSEENPIGLSWYYNEQSMGVNDTFFDKDFENFRVWGSFNYNSPVFGLSSFDVTVTNRGLKPLASQEASSLWTTVMDSARFNWPERVTIPK
jgi:hypothetical protein